MTLTCDQSDAAAAVVASSTKRKCDNLSKSETKKSRTDLPTTEDRLKQLNPSQIDAEFRVLQSLIPQIAHRQQLSEVRTQSGVPTISVSRKKTFLCFQILLIA